MGGDPLLVATWQGTGSVILDGETTTFSDLTKIFLSNGDYLFLIRVEGGTYLLKGSYIANPERGSLVTTVTDSTPDMPEVHGRNESEYSISSSGDSLHIWTDSTDQRYTRAGTKGAEVFELKDVVELR